jgi:hypothetical protein
MDHAASVAVLRRRDLHLIVPTLALAEVLYFVGERLGPSIETRFLRGFGRMEIEPPIADDWPIIADLVEQYADFPLGAIDASVVVLADRLEADVIVTLDRRHFSAVRSTRGRHFRLLPEASSVHEQPATYDTEPA